MGNRQLIAREAIAARQSRNLQAVLMSQPAHSLIQSTSGAIIHSVFFQAANLLLENGEILSLVTPTLGAQPISAVINGTSEPLFNLMTPGQPATISPILITIGSTEVQLNSELESWDPMPLWRLLSLPPAPSNWGEKFSEKLALTLAGAGPGLTPAGDDFLIGAFYAVWARRSSKDPQQLCQSLADLATPRTTTLSASMLNCAARGWAGSRWHTLVAALIAEGSIRIEQAMADIRATGDTSGQAALDGFFWGLSDQLTPPRLSLQ